MRKHLKLQVLAVAKHPASYGLCDVIRSLLTDLGATPNELARALPSADEVARHQTKRPMDRAASGQAGAADAAKAAKRRRLDAPAEHDG